MNKNKNKKIGLVIVGVIVLAAVFYGGMAYGGNNVRAAIMSRGVGNFTGRMRGATGTGTGGFTTGQIIGKDANSITISLQTGGPASPSQGGSKIIFLDSNAKISKSVAGTAADLTVGTEVVVTGTANPDGSMSAQTVQIRPAVVK